jgi:hypothetical protein
LWSGVAIEEQLKGNCLVEREAEVASSGSRFGSTEVVPPSVEEMQYKERYKQVRLQYNTAANLL